MAACLNIGSMTAGRDATNGKENATIVSVHNRTRARVFFELVVAFAGPLVPGKNSSGG